MGTSFHLWNTGCLEYCHQSLLKQGDFYSDQDRLRYQYTLLHVGLLSLQFLSNRPDGVLLGHSHVFVVVMYLMCFSDLGFNS